MSSSELPPGNDFDLLDRTVSETRLSVHPFNRNRPDFENQEVQGPDNTPGEATSYTKLIKILHEAKEHQSKTVRRNLTIVASGLEIGSYWIDGGQYHAHGCKDPELDVNGARGSKFRIMKEIREEAEKLGTKEFESVMHYLEVVLEGMRDIRCWRQRNGWDDRMMQFGDPYQG
ncbi:hypothetical protein IFR05_001576 [Cadophora sp. M221]|nr:hypothetical protein IFR05_001576 [Cadophora sp. M221]